MVKISFWHIILALFVFGLLIFIHELGHFLVAKKCGVTINEFAIGMGPRIGGWESKKDGTKYSLRLFPIGGYVSMLGEDEDAEGEGAFNNKKVWQRMLVVIAGPLMNLLLGFLAMLILVLSSGTLYSTGILYPETENVQLSESCGLQSGDRILKVGKVPVHTRYELVYEIMSQGYEPVDITINRNGEKKVIGDVVFPTIEESGVVFGGVDFYPDADEKNIANVIKHTFFRSVSTVKMIVDSFVDLLSGRYGLEAVSGPVGITQTIGASASQGFQSFLFVFVVITINLGVFNLFPLPALDGGRFLFLLTEAVLRRPVNRKVEGYINFVGLALMLLAVAAVTFNDILRLF